MSCNKCEASAECSVDVGACCMALSRQEGILGSHNQNCGKWEKTKNAQSQQLINILIIRLSLNMLTRLLCIYSLL